MRMKTHDDIVWDAVHSRSDAALSAIAASWCRSALKHGLDPADRRRGERIGDQELGRLREANAALLRVASPILDSLHELVGKSGCGVILTDADGLVLDRRTVASDTYLFDENCLAPGASWSEATEGTNGIGTCLKEGRPVTIHRGQHFHSRNALMSCMDAPVHDEQGRLVAALDVSSCRDDHDEAMASLIAAVVTDAARRIERTLFVEAFPSARILCRADAPGLGPALLAVDRDDLVIGASHAARRLYQLTESSFTAPRPAADVLGGEGDERFEESERAVLKRSLARTDGNVAAAARLLGIGRATFYRRMERAGLSER